MEKEGVFGMGRNLIKYVTYEPLNWLLQRFIAFYEMGFKNLNVSID